jgi:small-conductance mechanosensitive channel
MTVRPGTRRLAILFFALVSASVAQAPSKPGELRGAAVIAHLERMIAWYREVDALNTSAAAGGDVVLRDTAHQNALGALQLAFDFARAEALFKAQGRHSGSEDDSGAPSAESHNVDQLSVRAAARVAGLQNKLGALDTALAKAPAKSRALLEAQKKVLDAQLTLAKEIQNTVAGMVNFVGSGAAGSGSSAGLAGQINDLQSTIPESRHSPNHSAAPKVNGTPVGGPIAGQPGSQGLIGLVTDVISQARARMQMHDLLSKTGDLLKNVDELKSPVSGALRESIQKSDAMAESSGTETVDQSAAGQREIDAFIIQFKQLSAVAVPLSEEQILIENCSGALAEWDQAIGQQYGIVARYLMLRTATMTIAVLVILVCSHIWRRATIRLIRDARRQKQLLVLRRVIVGLAITVAVFLGFVTQFGSIATYAGFLTAGLAVALQNVILAVVAYFFLIGRYGVRVGDRVTISGVTGDVIDLGLVRLYLMEYAGSGADLHPTGRVVVFSNAILFQPQAIYKQLPGTNYVWHSVTLTLVADTNLQEAERRLGKAVGAVYEQYRPAIEKQHAELERSVDMPVEAPAPDCQLRPTDAGFEFKARYPVELRRTSNIDDQMIKALQAEIARDPQLIPAPSGMPKVQSNPA